MSNKLNEEKLEHFKEANLQTFDNLTNFVWNFYGKLELINVRNVHLEGAVFCGQFYREAQIIFWWNFVIS